MEEKYYYKKGINQKCFMCDDLATTGDHIPPQGFFTTSLRKQNNYHPLKIPACEKHNNISKHDDEYARLVLATGSPRNQQALQLFDERIIPRAQESGRIKLMSMIYNQMQPTLVKRPSGILTVGYKFEIDKTRLQNVIKKIAYGLYWHHNGHRVPDSYEVSHYCFDRQVPQEQINVICSLPLLSVGHSSVFEYRYAEVGNDKNQVYIAMRFFESRLIEITIKKTNT